MLSSTDTLYNVARAGCQIPGETLLLNLDCSLFLYTSRPLSTAPNKICHEAIVNYLERGMIYKRGLRPPEAYSVAWPLSLKKGEADISLPIIGIRCNDELVMKW
jgi:hypothetical protein